MLGPLTIGRKAASWGYRKYGVPGAVATGAAGVAGYVAVRRLVRRAATDDVGDQSGGETGSGDRAGR